MTALVVVPTMSADALAPCLRRMHPDLLERLLIVDNSVSGVGEGWPGMTYRPEPHTHERDYQPRCNIGVARSMNLAALAVLGGAADAVLWISTSVRFGRAGGRDLAELADKPGLGVIGSPTALHAFALRREAFELVGLWDTNLFPAYFEDTDWRRRLHLAGGALPEIPIDAHHVRDGHGYDLLRAVNPGRCVINFDKLKGYYASKWGGVPGEERYDRPFGDPTHPLEHWEPVTREQLIDRYGLGL